jgi:hypothetical protein
MPRRVFQIGFNKCGTRSISAFFKNHGLRTADWERGDLATSIKCDLAAGERPLKDWDHIDVFSDMEKVTDTAIIEGYRHFRELHRAYPDALFILNTRNVEHWVRSRMAHGSGNYTRRYRINLRLGSDSEVMDRWRKDWFEHHSAVLDYFIPDFRNSLFIWDLENPDFEALAEMCGIAVDSSKWEHKGRTKKAG